MVLAVRLSFHFPCYKKFENHVSPTLIHHLKEKLQSFLKDCLGQKLFTFSLVFTKRGKLLQYKVVKDNLEVTWKLHEIK